MVDKARKDEIRARCDVATPGPWLLGSWGDDVFSVQGDRSEGRNWKPICRVKRDDLPAGASQDHLDAAFIAHARQDIPSLLDDNERLEAENERLRLRIHGAIADLCSGYFTQRQVADDLAVLLGEESASAVLGDCRD